MTSVRRHPVPPAPGRAARAAAIAAAVAAVTVLAGCGGAGTRSGSHATSAAAGTTRSAGSTRSGGTTMNTASTSGPAATGVSSPAAPSPPGRSAATGTSSASGTATGGPCPALTVGVDGSVAPLFCADGSDNPAALAYYQGGWVKGFTPKVLELPATAGYGQVTAAVCADVYGHGSPMGLQTEQQAYDLAANRARWQYHINTVNGLTCPAAGTP